MTHIAKLGQFLLMLSAAYATSRPITMYAPGRPTSVEHFVGEIAVKSDTPGSLVVQGDCGVNDGTITTPLDHPPSGPFRNLDQALARLVQADKDLRWTRAADGSFRVNDRRVPKDVLDLRIDHFQFDKSMSVESTVAQLIRTPEVERYFTGHGIQHGILTPGITSGPRRRNNVDLSPMLSNISLRDALDAIAKADHGIWGYSECLSGHTRRVVIQGAPI